MHRILLKIGPINIYAYGAMLALAFIFGLMLARARARKQAVDEDKITDLCFYLLLWGIIGSRLLYIVLNWQYYRDNLLDVVKVWEGGLVFYGGFILAFLFFLMWFIRNNKQSFLKILDILVAPVALGIFLGRLGCFLNGCCYGRISQRWGMIFPAKDNPPVFSQQIADGLIKPDAVCSLPVVPTQLYAALHGLLILIIILYLERKPRFKGFSFLVFVLLYATGRFFIEFFRFYESNYIFLNFTISQWISMLVMGITLIFLVRSYKKAESKG